MVAPPDAARSAALAGQAASNLAAKSEERAAPGAAVPVPAADRADIRPLDMQGALQILVSEVRAELDAALLAMDAAVQAPPARVDDPQAAVRSLVETALTAYLQPQDFASFAQAVVRIEAAWQTGVARALEVVSSWKEVPDSVVDSVRGAIAQSEHLMDAESLSPLALRAEWLGLAPRLERYRRRRRRLRRWLADPDFKLARLDDDVEPPS